MYGHLSVIVTRDPGLQLDRPRKYSTSTVESTVKESFRKVPGDLDGGVRVVK